MIAKVVLFPLLSRFNYCTFAAQTALSPFWVIKREESPDTIEKHSG